VISCVASGEFACGLVTDRAVMDTALAQSVAGTAKVCVEEGVGSSLLARARAMLGDATGEVADNAQRLGSELIAAVCLGEVGSLGQETRCSQAEGGNWPVAAGRAMLAQAEGGNWHVAAGQAMLARAATGRIQFGSQEETWDRHLEEQHTACAAAAAAAAAAVAGEVEGRIESCQIPEEADNAVGKPCQNDSIQDSDRYCSLRDSKVRVWRFFEINVDVADAR